MSDEYPSYSSRKIGEQGYVPASEGVPKFLLDDKVKLDALKSYARAFFNAAEIAKQTGNTHDLRELGVSRKDAAEFLANSKINPDFAYEKMASKEFLQVLQGGDGHDKETIFGKYREAAHDWDTGMAEAKEKLYKAGIRQNLNPTEATDAELSRQEEAFIQKSQEVTEKTGETHEVSAVEKMSEFGPGKKSPICLNSAAVMSQMLDAGGIPNHLVFCNATFPGDYGLLGGHVIVVSDKTGNLFEATDSNPDDAYCVTLACDSAKGVNAEHPLVALKNGGSVVVAYSDMNPNSVTLINTRDDARTLFSELGTSRFVMDTTAKGLEIKDWVQAKLVAASAMRLAHRENSDKSGFSVPLIRTVLEHDAAATPETPSVPQKAPAEAQGAAK